MSKLTLKRPVLTNEAKTSAQDSKKPEPSKKSSKKYEDFGKIIQVLRDKGYKIKLDKPLSKMIYRQIKNALPPGFMTNAEIYEAIGFHVHSPKYLLKLRTGEVRFDIKGKKDGKVTEEESKFALETLYQHHAKFMRDRRKRKANPIKAKRGNSRVQFRKNQRS